MRLTADVINNAQSYINLLGERELGLRGHKIPAIENLGAAHGHDTIDFIDNEIAYLGNFPYMERLHHLMLAHNRISQIQPNLHESIPRLDYLSLQNNRMKELADLEPLRHFQKLESLVLKDNPVAKKEHYRSYVIWLCPALRFLDFNKIKKADRTAANALYGTASEPTELAQKIATTRASTTQPLRASASAANGEETAAVSQAQYTDREREKIRERIKNAGSLAEMTKLEKMLAAGTIPRDLLVGEDEEDKMEGVVSGGLEDET